MDDNCPVQDVLEVGAITFDGPTPFDGDPAYDHVAEVVAQPPKKIRDAVARAFDAVHQEWESMRHVDVASCLRRWKRCVSSSIRSGPRWQGPCSGGAQTSAR